MGTGATGPQLPSPPRLARSTLTLVPLLGVHEVVFAPVTEEQARGHLRFAKLGFEIFLSSFQVLRPGAGAAPFWLGPFSPERPKGYSHPLAQPLKWVCLCEFIHSAQNAEPVLFSAEEEAGAKPGGGRPPQYGLRVKI